MSENFTVEIISPEKSILNTEAKEVVIPSFEGEMGILRDHISLITFLRPGIIKVEGNEKNNFFIISGVIDFKNNKLNILSDSIYETHKIDSKKLNELKEEAITKIKENNLTDQDIYLTSTLINEIDNFDFR